MNNELQRAKDQAAQEAGYNTFEELLSVDGYLSDNTTLINRAMEIYAEGELNSIKRYADSFHGSGHDYWFILGKVDDMIRHKINQFKPTKP